MWKVLAVFTTVLAVGGRGTGAELGLATRKQEREPDPKGGSTAVRAEHVDTSAAEVRRGCERQLRSGSLQRNPHRRSVERNQGSSEGLLRPAETHLGSVSKLL